MGLTMPATEIHQGDCFDVLRRWSGPLVDFVFADLPYGTTSNKWDSVLDLAQLWPLLRSVCKPNAAMCFTAQQPFTTTLINSNPREFRYDVVWRKSRPTGFLNANKMPLKQHESVLVFYIALPTYNPQKWQGVPYSVTAGGRVKSTNYGNTTREKSVRGVTERHPTSVIEFGSLNPNVNKRYPLHPTQKPVDLLEYLIRTYTNPGDLVLDPTAGALTTAVAAHTTGRRAVCVEIRRRYVDIGVQRLVDAGAEWRLASENPDCDQFDEPDVAEDAEDAEDAVVQLDMFARMEDPGR